MDQNKVTTDFLQNLVHEAEANTEGHTADYIPELASVDKEITAIAVNQLGHDSISYRAHLYSAR